MASFVTKQTFHISRTCVNQTAETWPMSIPLGSEIFDTATVKRLANDYEPK